MVDSRDNRRETRRTQATELFGKQANAALAIFELLDLAWHDCYGQSAPPQEVVDDIWTASLGRLDYLAIAANLAVIDFRDLRMNAERIRAGGAG